MMIRDVGWFQRARYLAEELVQLEDHIYGG